MNMKTGSAGLDWESKFFIFSQPAFQARNLITKDYILAGEAVLVLLQFDQ